MGTIRTLFDAVVEAASNGNKIEVGVADRNEYETIRTRLVRFWTEHKEVIIAVGGEDSDPLLQLGMCGDFDPSTGLATFYLGRPRRKMAKSYSFSIVATDATSESVNEQLPTPSIPKSGNI